MKVILVSNQTNFECYLHKYKRITGKFYTTQIWLFMRQSTPSHICIGLQWVLVRRSCGNAIRGPSSTWKSIAIVSVHPLAFWGQILLWQKPVLQHSAWESSILSILARTNGPYCATSNLHCTPEGQQNQRMYLTKASYIKSAHFNVRRSRG